MNARAVAARAGLQRGRIEIRQTVTSADVVGWVWPSVVAVIVLYILRDSTVAGTGFSLGAQAIPGILGMNVVFIGVLGLSATLVTEREDGTLLRVKATPNGMLGYLIGKVVGQAGLAAALMVVVLVPAAFLFDGLELGRMTSWLTVAWVLVLGLAATLPIGAILGSLVARAQNLGFVMLLFMGLVAISGVFYPITALPGWLQMVGQAFPVYWLGLGMRSALLPDAVAAAEIGGSWRQPATVVVLAAWAAIGLGSAPAVLRRMARRPSGSSVTPGR